MFGRGAWAIFGLGKESLEAFRRILEDRAVMVVVSQMAASAITRYSNDDSVGINPFSAPRLDEEHPVGSDYEPELAAYATSELEERSKLSLPAEILDCQGYGIAEARFRLHPTMPWYGLWAVSNERKDVSDLASIKEQRSYSLLDRPYKFLQATDRKTVDQDTFGVTAPVRKQVSVLLDFHEDRVYIENKNGRSSPVHEGGRTEGSGRDKGSSGRGRRQGKRGSRCDQGSRKGCEGRNQSSSKEDGEGD